MCVVKSIQRLIIWLRLLETLLRVALHCVTNLSIMFSWCRSFDHTFHCRSSMWHCAIVIVIIHINEMQTLLFILLLRVESIRERRACTMHEDYNSRNLDIAFPTPDMLYYIWRVYINNNTFRKVISGAQVNDVIIMTG